MESSGECGLVARRVSNVLAQLGQEVERLAEGDFSGVEQPDWNDETRDLALAVNQTANRLAQYESELRQTERLRTVAMLGAGLAHEMRNAATGCRLAVDLHAEDCHSDRADDSLDVARHQLLLMEDKLQQLLQLGNQSSVSMDQLIDCRKLVSHSVDLITPAAVHAGIRILWSEPEEEVAVNADSVQLGQAVTNVLLNALDAAAKNQAAGNHTGQVSIELKRLEQELELAVTDSGEGPNGELAESVFEPFVTGKSEGVGLGLALAKQAVESFGGHIGWCRNAGLTKFSIRLPLAAAGAIHV